MRIAVTKDSKYVPKWNGNRELAESEQFYLTYSNLSLDERAKYQTEGQLIVHIPDVYDAKTRDIDDAVKKATAPKVVDGDYTQGRVDRPGMVRAMKPEFHNFETEDGTPVKSWSDFLKLPVSRMNQLDALRSEIELALPETQEPIEEKDSKN